LRLIVGLGNPGAEYARTRHNLGFAVVEALAAEAEADFRRRGLSLRAHGSLHGEEDLIFAKPQTFMNLSGQAVVQLIAQIGLKTPDLHKFLLIHDDLDLDVGRIRMKARGGAGGNNGVLSIIDSLGTDEFARLKIGIGRPPVGMEAADYVLRPARGDERTLLQEAMERAVEAARCWISEGLAVTMNRFNRPPVE
jgi:peptidyl-tRNA hydrolase, PTH1 family